MCTLLWRLCLISMLLTKLYLFIEENIALKELLEALLIALFFECARALLRKLIIFCLSLFCLPFAEALASHLRLETEFGKGTAECLVGNQIEQLHR